MFEFILYLIVATALFVCSTAIAKLYYDFYKSKREAKIRHKVMRSRLKDEVLLISHLDNTKLALKIWLERVKPEDVVSYLKEWTCGTQACFGGHLPRWPEFQAMGVMANRSGAPFIEHFGEIPSQVADFLFGDSLMFSTRLSYENGTDYEVVIKRLQRRIRELSDQLRNRHSCYLPEVKGR